MHDNKEIVLRSLALIAVSIVLMAVSVFCKIHVEQLLGL